MKTVLVIAAVLGLSASAALAECAGHPKVTASVDTEMTTASIMTEMATPTEKTDRIVKKDEAETE